MRPEDYAVNVNWVNEYRGTADMDSLLSAAAWASEKKSARNLKPFDISAWSECNPVHANVLVKRFDQEAVP